MSTPTPVDSPAAPLRRSTQAGRLAGAVGVMLLVTVPFTWLLTEEGGLYLGGKLVAGLLLVGAYLMTNADFFARLSGARSTGLWAMTVVGALVVIGIVGAINFLVLENDREVDFTREGIYTLSQPTRDLLDRLKQEVVITAFYASHENAFPGAKETLQRYARASTKVTFTIVSPQERPDLVERYQITEQGARVVVQSGDQEARARDTSEMELTNAIVRVAEQSSKVVAFLSGHGEPGLEPGGADEVEALASAAQMLRAEGYEVRELSLLRAATAGTTPGKLALAAPVEPAGDTLKVPADVTVLVAAGVSRAMLPQELAALSAFLERGGRLIVALDARVDAGLTDWLAGWKIEVHDDIVVDANVVNRLLGLGPAAPMAYAASEHPATDGLEAPGVMFMARSLAIKSGGEPSINTQPLLLSDESAWGETMPVAGSAERGDDDHQGPVPLAVVATRHVPSHLADRLTDEARLVAVGDSDWLNDRYLPLQGNADLFVNLVNWLAAEEERITVGRKTRAASQVFFSLGQLDVLKFVTLDLLWVLYVAAGLGIVLIRRQR